MQSGVDLEALSHAAQRLVELYLSRAGTEWDERDVVEELRRCACAPTLVLAGRAESTFVICSLRHVTVDKESLLASSIGRVVNSVAR